MKKALILGLIGAAFAGCGADLDTTTMGEPEAFSAEEAHSAVLIDTIEWRGEQITFHDISGPGDTVPAILVSYLGDGSRPELSVVLDQQGQYEPTPAEIWRSVRGDTDIPAELLEQHAWQSEEESRPEGFQEFDLDAVQKALLPNFSTMFPLNTTATGLPDSSNRCWAFGGLRVFHDKIDASICSGGSVSVRDANIQTSPCDPILNVNATERTGSFNGGGPGSGMLSKTCGATGNPGTWSCTSAVSMSTGQYFASTLAKNGSAHRMGTGLFVPLGAFAIPTGYLGAAELSSPAARFTDTSCTGFSTNF